MWAFAIFTLVSTLIVLFLMCKWGPYIETSDGDGDGTQKRRIYFFYNAPKNFAFYLQTYTPPQIKLPRKHST